MTYREANRAVETIVEAAIKNAPDSNYAHSFALGVLQSKCTDLFYELECLKEQLSTTTTTKTKTE